MELIQGGVCASKGFLAGAVHCGVRKSQSKLDLAVIYSKKPCAAAAVYTTNQVKADCLKLTKEHLSNGKAQAIICNSGNANACAPFGKENALKEAVACAKLTQMCIRDRMQMMQNDPKMAGKSEKVLQGILKGKVDKHFKDLCLNDQEYFLEPKQKVSQFLKENGAEAVCFVRYQAGEGIEKKEENFAEEVMSQIKG